MNRRGYTVIELLVVMTVVGIVANIALPAVQRSKKRAEAAAVLADVLTIRHALVDYYASVNDFPRTARWGTVPQDLESSLPTGFVFDDGKVRYRWRRFWSAATPADRATGHHSDTEWRPRTHAPRKDALRRHRGR